jgi:Holliday junction DNA helicase RuvB
MANRPLTLDDYIGQERIKTQLRIILTASIKNKRALPHMLLYGNPGLGKTTLAEIVANEFGTNIRVAMGGSLLASDNIRDLFANLSECGGDIIFIDEIHRMPTKIEEMLYSLMEDEEIEMNGQWFSVPPFTLIGATTLMGDLSRPLRDRFGAQFQLQNYQLDELAKIIAQVAAKEEIKITDQAINEIAKRAKGVARLAINFYKRCKEFAEVFKDGFLDEEVTRDQFSMMGIDELGLDENDYRVLNFLAEQTRPVGANVLATGCDIDTATINSVIEPYLAQQGLISRTRQGREITLKGLQLIGAVSPEEVVQQVVVRSNNRRSAAPRLR